MLLTDLSTLRDRLAELAELFDRKPLTEKALRLWFDTLKEFPIERVAGMLIGWPKMHTKFPAPAELWKACNEIGIREREDKALQERTEFYPSVGGEQAKLFIRQIQETLKKPKITAREHWERVIESHAPGTIGHRYASEALLKMGARTAAPVVEREPGQDDEERHAA